MADHDVMIGSRYVPGGGVEGGFTLKRRLMSSGINSYARLMLGLTSRDNSGAFRCYRVSKLAEIDLDQVRSRGYSFQEEILYWCKTVGCRIGETPILFENRRAGISKINMREAVSALWILLQLGVARWRAASDGQTPKSPEGSSTTRRRTASSPDGPPISGSGHLALADGHVDFLAGLGDFLAQSLVLALELAGVHAQHLAEKGAVAGVGLAGELVERFFDLIGQIEQELGLSLDIGQRALAALARRCRLERRSRAVSSDSSVSSLERRASRDFRDAPFLDELMAGLPGRASRTSRRPSIRARRTVRPRDACSGSRA